MTECLQLCSFFNELIGQVPLILIWMGATPFTLPMFMLTIHLIIITNWWKLLIVKSNQKCLGLVIQTSTVKNNTKESVFKWSSEKIDYCEGLLPFTQNQTVVWSIPHCALQEEISYDYSLSLLCGRWTIYVARRWYFTSQFNLEITQPPADEICKEFLHVRLGKL